MDTKAYIESGIIESYVLGLATPEEVAEVELLAAQYSEIKDAIDNFERSIEQQAMLNSVQPPPELKNKLFSVINSEASDKTDDNLSQKAQVIEMKQEKIETAKIVSIWKYAAVASLIILVASTALNFYLYNNLRTVNHNYQALLIQKNHLQANNQVYNTQLKKYAESFDIIKNPDMEVVEMQGVEGRKNNLATIYWNSKTKDVFVLANKMPAAPKGKQFQLWAIVNGKPVDAGVLGSCDDELCKMKNIPQAQAFAITLEQEGGSPTPTLSEMYVMGSI